MNHLFSTSLVTFLLTGCGGSGSDSATTRFTNAPGTYNRTLIVHESMREFIVHVPELAQRETDVPLVFFLHGTGGNGQAFADSPVLWTPKADKEGFIVVYPTALEHCHFDKGVQKEVTKWASGDLGDVTLLPLCDGQELADDMTFFDEMVNLLKNEYSIDEKRMYVSGFSNGAGMAARLSAQRSNIFAAAAFSGGAQSSALPTTLAERPMSVLSTIGNMDPLFADALGLDVPVPLSVNLANYNGFQMAVSPLLSVQGLSGDFEFSAPVYGTTATAEFFYNSSIDNNGNYVRFVIIDGLQHSYTPALVDAYWNFFLTQSLP